MSIDAHFALVMIAIFISLTGIVSCIGEAKREIIAEIRKSKEKP